MEQLESLKIIFKNLSDISRLKIVLFIGKEEKAVGDVVSYLGLSQPLVSHHLKKLRDCGILSAKRKGPFVNYSLSNIKILDIINNFKTL